VLFGVEIDDDDEDAEKEMEEKWYESNKSLTARSLLQLPLSFQVK